MIKTAPTLPRIAAMVLFALSCFGLLLYLWLAFGGTTPLAPKGYRFDVLFPEAAQLSRQADVRISGVDVGKVVALAPAAVSGQERTRATIQLESRYAPVPRDTRAMLRIKTLLGETYVELTPGRRSSGMLPEGGTLPAAAVSPTVELDEVLQSFDPQTRRAFATWMQSQAAAVRGRGADINASFGLAPGFVEKFDRLFAVLDAQRSATRKMISTTGEVFDAISRREGELRGLVTDSQRLFGVTAARNQDLAAIFRQLPRFERESTQTLPDLASFASAARPVVRQLLPAADELTPTFQALNRLSPEFQGFFGKLSEVVAASKRGLPAFEHVLDRLPGLLDAFQPFLRNANPMVRYIGENRRYVTALFANTTAASLARDVALPGTKTPVHYLRTSQTLDPLALSFYPRPPASARDNAYLAPNAFDQLASGLPVLTAGPCQDGEPAAPTAADPETLVPLVQAFAFRSDGGSVAAPGCRAQGDFPGFPTAFPQLRAEP